MGEPVGNLDCPYCGYDLRGVLGSESLGSEARETEPVKAVATRRCSECGGDVSAIALSAFHNKAGRLPWFHRKSLGNASALGATVWLLLRRPHRLANELALPVDEREAKCFLRWATWPLAVIAGSAMAGWVSMSPTFKPLQQPMDVVLLPEISRDVTWPLMISAQGFWVGLTVALAIWALPRSLVTAFVLHREGDRPSASASRAASLSRYLGVSIVPLGVGLTLLGVVGMLTADPFGFAKTAGGRWSENLSRLGLYGGVLWTLIAVTGGLIVLLRKSGAGLIRTGAILLIMTLQTAVVLATVIATGMWLPGYVRLMWAAG